MIEAVISIFVVGLTLVAAMSLAGLSGAGQIGAFQQRRAHMLASELLSEIMSQDYLDPDLLEQFWISIEQSGSITLSGGDEFGPAAGEVTGSRNLFDDVDDYHNWTASPPQDKDGTVHTDLADWGRSVVVESISPSGFGVLPSSDQGLRRITVTASFNGNVMASVIGFKSAGLPPLQACCECGGTCLNLPVRVCASRGGNARGFGTSCSTDACGRVKVAVVTHDPTNFAASELDRIAVLESMDFSVTTIEDEDTQATYDTLAATIDVFYLTDSADMNKVGTKLNNVTVGVLTEHRDSIEILGFSSNHATNKHADIDIVDTSHYITAISTTGVQQTSSSSEEIHMLKGTVAGGVSILANRTGDSTLVPLAAIDTGGALYGGGTAAGRRVKLPWSDRTDLANLTPAALTILERSVLWAAGCEAAATCGNGVCEAGEDCHNCADCPGVSTGLPSEKYCCGDGVTSQSETDQGLCDGNY